MSDYMSADKLVADTINHFEEKYGVPVRETKCRLDELEQKFARRNDYGGTFEPQTWGAQFAAAPELKNFAEFTSRPSRFSMEVKAITSASASAGVLAEPYRDATLAMPKRRLRMRDLLPVVQVSNGAVEYARQSAYTNASATVAEGALKPESSMTFDLVAVPIRTVAHWIPASRQILDDAPQLRTLIDTELRYGLAYAEDLQLLLGTNVGTDLNGIYNQATTFAAGDLVFGGSANRVDVLLAAIHQNDLANLPADGIVLHPSDWTEIRALKDGQGQYLMGPPAADVAPNLFGIPVVTTPAMAAGSFLVGNFQGSATLYDRWTPRVEVSTEHADFFTRNLVAILCEERIGLAVKRPTGFTKGTFAAAITDLAA